jgi:glycosyltransferase involved in cell wall biosynthesis
MNEERNLARALRSIALLADEMVVVDSGSTDQTREIAAGFNARFLEHAWEGYARQKNYAASQARYDWIFSMDADEAASPQLAWQLQQLKEAGAGEMAGFTMPRLTCYRGRWIRHCGWYPDRKLRLYDRRRGRWEGDYVHEGVRVAGEVGALSGNLLHYTCDSVGEHLRTLERYTTLAAQEAAAQGKPWRLSQMLALPPWKFLETYVFRQGFRDGVDGFLIATLAGYYVWRKHAKLRQMTRARQADGKEPADSQSVSALESDADRSLDSR